MTKPNDPKHSLDPLMPPPAFDDDPADFDTLDNADDVSMDLPPSEASLADGPFQGTDKQTADPKRPHNFPTVEGYELQKKLGQGGMGSVYLAIDEKLQRGVALKLLSGKPSEKNLHRFQTEIKSVAAISHPNVAQIFAADLLDRQPYYSMEYVDGKTLEEQIQTNPQLPIDAAKLILILARTIDFCHSKEIIHRDLKPSNILLDGIRPSR